MVESPVNMKQYILDNAEEYPILALRKCVPYKSYFANKKESQVAVKSKPIPKLTTQPVETKKLNTARSKKQIAMNRSPVIPVVKINAVPAHAKKVTAVPVIKVNNITVPN